MSRLILTKDWRRRIFPGPKAEHKAIDKGLSEIQAEINAGTFPFSAEFEDIHLNIEARLKDKIGDAAGRLHTGRSRNDQVATDFRLWVRDHLDQFDAQLDRLQRALLDQAELNCETIMPGFTHLQNAQPVTYDGLSGNVCP